MQQPGKVDPLFWSIKIIILNFFGLMLEVLLIMFSPQQISSLGILGKINNF